FGAPYGTRTRVSAVKGRCPRPLDEGRLRRGRHIEAFARCGKEAAVATRLGAKAVTIYRPSHCSAHHTLAPMSARRRCLTTCRVWAWKPTAPSAAAGVPA